MSDRQPEEQVRRLLREARAEEPMPDDVAARIDDVLADLARQGTAPTAAPTAAPTGDPTAAPAVSLDAARRSRRRRLRTALVAAAAVVVVGGVSLTQSGLLGDAGGSDSRAGGDSAASSAKSGDTDGPPALDGGMARSPEARLDPAAPGADQPSALPTLDSDRFDAQVRRLPRASASAGGVAPCDAAVRGAGERIAVTYDGLPAVLVYRAPAQGRQRVDLFRCGQATPLRSTSVPAP